MENVLTNNTVASHSTEHWLYSISKICMILDRNMNWINIAVGRKKEHTHTWNICIRYEYNSKTRIELHKREEKKKHTFVWIHQMLKIFHVYNSLISYQSCVVITVWINKTMNMLSIIYSQTFKYDIDFYFYFFFRVTIFDWVTIKAVQN